MINNLPAATAIRPDSDRVVMRTAAILLGIEGLLLFVPLGGWAPLLAGPRASAIRPRSRCPGCSSRSPSSASATSSIWPTQFSSCRSRSGRREP